jgi:hypothetical protein
MAKKVFLAIVWFCLIFETLSAQEQQEQEAQEWTWNPEWDWEQAEEPEPEQAPQEQEQQLQELVQPEEQAEEEQQEEYQEREAEQAPQEQEQQQQEQEQEQKKSCFTLSAGGGIFIGGEIGGGISAENYRYDILIKVPYFGGGGFLFFDAAYAEISFGVWGGGGNLASFVNLNIGLLGRYPFRINDKFSVFPLLGIDYQITVSAKLKDGGDILYSDFTTGEEKIAGDLSALWFKFGGGLDYRITEKVYARAQALYGLRAANKFETIMENRYKWEGYSAKTLLGHGPTVKLAVGYKF